MLQVEVLICKLAAINANLPCSIAFHKIAALEHELFDDLRRSVHKVNLPNIRSGSSGLLGGTWILYSQEAIHLVEIRRYKTA